MSVKIQIDWKSIIYRGVESEELDYKAALDWRKLNRGSKAKFVRHCLALANTKGGYIVVGVGEDSAGQPSLFTGLSGEQAKSFDPTIVGNFINKYADPEIDFTIERPIIDGKRYAIFVIRRFSNIPHVCSYGLENELQQGVFYIRTADASSRPAYRASEIHGIIQRALRNQREILGRMIRGVLYEERVTIEQNAKSHFAEERAHSRTFFDRRSNNVGDISGIRIDIMVAPQQYIPEKFSLSELKQAFAAVISLQTSNSFISESEIAESYFSNISLRSMPARGKKLWQMFQSGMFHYINVWNNSSKTISYLELVKFFAEAVSFFSQLYSELGYCEELLDIRIEIDHVEAVRLINTPEPLKKLDRESDCVCRIPQIKLQINRTTADLASGYIDHAAKIILEVCERFNLPEGRHRKLNDTIKKYLEKRR